MNPEFHLFFSFLFQKLSDTFGPTPTPATQLPSPVAVGLMLSFFLSLFVSLSVSVMDSWEWAGLLVEVGGAFGSGWGSWWERAGLLVGVGMGFCMERNRGSCCPTIARSYTTFLRNTHTSV